MSRVKHELPNQEAFQRRVAIHRKLMLSTRLRARCCWIGNRQFGFKILEPGNSIVQLYCDAPFVPRDTTVGDEGFIIYVEALDGSIQTTFTHSR